MVALVTYVIYISFAMLGSGIYIIHFTSAMVAFGNYVLHVTSGVLGLGNYVICVTFAMPALRNYVICLLLRCRHLAPFGLPNTAIWPLEPIIKEVRYLVQK